MFSLRINENGVITDARCSPKGTVVIKYTNRDVWFIRRDMLARVWIEAGSDDSTSELRWSTHAAPETTWAITLPQIGESGDRYVASAMFDSIIYGGDDVVWMETIDERELDSWQAIGLDDITVQRWPECIANPTDKISWLEPKASK